MRPIRCFKSTLAKVGLGDGKVGRGDGRLSCGEVSGDDGGEIKGDDGCKVDRYSIRQS